MAMYAAKLRCGTVLEYEAPSFVPNDGELVPCRHHGYCAIEVVGRTRGRSRTGLPRARPRSQQDLVDWLCHRSETSIHALKRQRFTLRMIAAAEREGRVEVDYRTGRVVVRSRGDSEMAP
jgi:hypothetical protein